MNQLSRLNLHERLKKHAFDHAVITTFNFGVRFFEDYALENFRSLQENANISVIVDAAEYHNILETAKVSTDAFPKLANLRYLLHPVSVPGCFHPKVALFASNRRGLLLIGSANLTQEGLGSNAELVVPFDYDDQNDTVSLPVFQSALRFLQQIAERWPSGELDSSLNAMIAEVPWLSNTPETPDSGMPEMLSNLDRPLWDQLVERLPGPASEVAALSRFFDVQPGLIQFVSDTTGAKRLALYTQNGITTLAREWLCTKAFRDGDLDIRLCSYNDGDYSQHLHAKGYAFVCGKQCVLAVGSANFTSAALRRTAANGNVEVLLCYPPISTKTISAKHLFDPGGTAVALRSADQLQTALDNTDERQEPIPTYPITILEAILEDDMITLRTDSASVPSGVVCQITQDQKRSIFMPLDVVQAPMLRCRLGETQKKPLRAKPAIAQLGKGTRQEWTPSSNPVFIINLQDAVTGRDLRRERQLREARESPQKFLDVLKVLCSGDDEERLKQFLTYCDIPIDLPTRLFRRRAAPRNAGGPGEDRFKISGAKNLRHFEVLHDAVMDFARRHQKRLDRHVEHGTAKGIPNFLHILLTIGSLLLSQIERIIAALESDTGLEISPDRWHQVRDNLDAYYRVLEELTETTATDYLDALFESTSPGKVSEEFAERLPELDELVGRALRNRERLLELQQSRLVVVTIAGPVTGPGFFSSILSPTKWSSFAGRLRGLENKLRERLVA